MGPKPSDRKGNDKMTGTLMTTSLAADQPPNLEPQVTIPSTHGGGKIQTPLVATTVASTATTKQPPIPKFKIKTSHRQVLGLCFQVLNKQITTAKVNHNKRLLVVLSLLAKLNPKKVHLLHQEVLVLLMILHHQQNPNKCQLWLLYRKRKKKLWKKELPPEPDIGLQLQYPQLMRQKIP